LTPPEGRLVGNYLNTLVKWQSVHRLVGSTDRAWLIDNVIVDSLRFLALIPDDIDSIVDIGSGAGIPGVPIAIVRPSVNVLLVEAMRRRVSFLANVIRVLPLPNASVVESRVERLGEEYAHKFDVAVMRCAGHVPLLLQDVLRLVRKGGVVLAASSPERASTRDDGGETVEVRDLPMGSARTFRRWRA
jgi:16S rRNA (guanine527-N7)-methyltransferase